MLSRDGYGLSLNPPEPGAIRLKWVLGGAGSQPVIARGTGALADVEQATIGLTLTRTGRALLNHAHRLRVLAEAVFSPPHGQPIRATRTFVLRR